MIAALWASALLDAVVATAAVWAAVSRRGSGDQAAGRPRWPNAARAAALAGAVAVFVLVKALVLTRLGLRPPFGHLHLVYLDLVVAVPLVGVAVLVLARRRRRRGQPLGRAARVLAVGAVLLAPAGAYASLAEPRRLEVETAEVPLAPDRQGREPVVIGVVADIQTARVTGHERTAVDRLMAQRPDVILLPGDLLQSPGRLERELPALRRLLGRLHAPGGVFFVLGDQDTRGELDPAVAGTDVRLLVNDVVRVRVRGRRLTIAGIELDGRAPAARAAVGRLEEDPGRRDVRIVLAHRPDVARDLRAGTRVDLVVAGHTHGGQVQLPLVGPVITYSDVPRAVAGGGLHDLGGGRRVYVSRGVGMERDQAPPVRFLAPPEVTVLRLATRR